jgi:O-succinylbenzoic acid--CoA ligase
LSTFKIIYLTENTDLISKVESFVSAWLNSDDFVETKTSGSTGSPKVIRLKKEKMAASAKMTGTYFSFQSGQKALLCLSPDTIGGKMMILRSFLFGLELYVVDINRNPLEKVDFSVNFAAMVPLQIQSIIEKNPEKLNLISQLLIGGANVSSQLEDSLKKFETVAFESFGMTETMSHVAVRKLNQETFQPFEALPGISFETEQNQLIVNAPHLGIEKLNTNDIIDLVDENHFFWQGRADFVINSGGIKFFSEKLERKISHLIEGKFFIASEKDILLGEKIILVLEEIESEARAKSLAELFKSKLDKFEIPKKIYFTETFDETVSGKINRKATLKRILV